MLKVRARCNHWLPKTIDMGAITIYPFIFFADENPAIELIQHEWVHIRQVRKLGWLKFYASYLCHYIAFWWKLKDRDAAYRAIPFEAEAYKTQSIAMLSQEEQREMGWTA